MRELLKTPDENSGSILQQLRDWLNTRSDVATIAIYSPLPGEIDITSLVAEFQDHRWLFPKVQESELILHHVTDIKNQLLPGAFGIREPQLELPEVHPFKVDAYFCPGLAFDSYGNRLGRGRGFYDRLLENARGDSFKIGICRSEQIVPDTFSEPHDIAMDLVISG